MSCKNIFDIWTDNLICVYYYILVGLSYVTCLLYENLLIIFYFWFYLSTDIFVKLTQYNCFYVIHTNISYSKNSIYIYWHMQKSRVLTQRICKCASIAEVSQYAWASGRRGTGTTEVMRERGSIKGTANRKKRMRNKTIKKHKLLPRQCRKH